MVCVHCQEDTQVINSRLQKRSNQVWRRRQCRVCSAIFTTTETIQYHTVWMVRNKSGALNPFLPNRLLLSLYHSLQHRSTAISDATELVQTIIAKLSPRAADGLLDSRTIVQVTQVALRRFDRLASEHYEAYHPSK